MANVQYNVGTWAGLLGTAIMYEFKTTGGTKFLGYKELQSDNTTVKWRGMPRSAMKAQMAAQKATLAAAVNIEDYAEVMPTGVNDVDGFLIVDNEGTPLLPRLQTNQALFSLKGTGVAAWEGTNTNSVTGTGNSDGSTVVINSGSQKTITEYINDGVTYVTKNPLILIAILFLLSELLGFTQILGLKKPKRKVARRR